MSSQPKLTWADVKSPTEPVQEYLQHIESEQFRHIHEERYASYVPNLAALQRLQGHLDSTKETLLVFVMGASWCKDCQLHVPALAKIEERLDSARFQVRILGGIKTRPLKSRGHDDIVWAIPPSPPEAGDAKFDLQAIPTLYLFDSKGELKGRIVEHLAHAGTLEEEILFLLEQ